MNPKSQRGLCGLPRRVVGAVWEENPKEPGVSGPNADEIISGLDVVLEPSLAHARMLRRTLRAYACHLLGRGAEWHLVMELGRAGISSTRMSLSSWRSGVGVIGDQTPLPHSDVPHSVRILDRHFGCADYGETKVLGDPV